jgi:amino acid adenylation domain-containing protein
VKIAVRQLLRDLGTLESLAAHLDLESPPLAGAPMPSASAFSQAAPLAAPELALAASGERIPLTESQREVWLLCQQSPAANSACNETWTLHLDGELDAAALARAVQEIVNRHDSLRCTFDPEGESLSVAPRLDIEIPLTDLSALPEAQREERLSSMRAAEGSFVFDLARGPLITVQIVRLAEQRHALIFNAHHIVCDGWSCDIFLSELAAIYSAAREGRPHDLPVAMQMREYQRWEEEMRRTPEFAAETRFWCDKYSTPPPLLELPGDRPHPGRRSYRGASEVITLPPALPQALVKLGARHGATLFTVLLAAYETLLFRLTGQSDLSIGIPYAGQNDTPGGAHLVGHCVNMLSLRSQLDGAQTFEARLDALQAGVSEALEHTRVTFGWLLQNLSLARLPGRVPLIPATFNVYPPLSHLHFPGLAHRIEPNPCGAFQFDLTINCDTTQGNSRLICKYNTDLFDAATVRRWMDHFQTLLEAVAANPAQPLDQLPLLDAAARQKLLLEWNDTRREFPPDALVHRLFEAQVERTPHAVAVTFGDEHLSYAALNRRANQLARKLQRLGVTRDVLAGICMERSIEMVVAIFAVLKAGGAYVPLDPSYPRERLAYMIADARMPVILTQSACAHLCGSGDSATPPAAHLPSLVCADTEDCAAEDPENLPGSLPADSLAYVLYTSGSTGAPKGVMIPHSAICNHMLWMQDRFPLDEHDRVLQKTSISFDASVWEFFAPLFAGARLVMAHPGGHRDSRYLAEAVAHDGITTLQLVPSMLRMLVDEPGLTACSATLRRLFCGGEALTPDLCDKFLSRMEKCVLINLYGPTECAIDTTFHLCAPGAKVVPIGRPVANTRLYILDAKSQPAPIGVTGELHIAGAQLARGYWSKPELTAAAFVSWNGERLYKTGDLARWLPGGEVEFLGRADGQVKLRGHRIELAEIENALRRLSGIADGAAVVREDTPGDKRLIAYLIRAQNGAGAESGINHRPSESALLSELKRSLPDYMVPSTLLFLPEFPRTPNGKLDRRALPAPDPAPHRNGEGVFIAPRTPLEQRLVEIWREVLRVPQIGIRDNFLALGGESLLALRVVNRLREMLAENVSLGVIFEAPTVESLSQHLESNFPLAIQRWLGLHSQTATAKSPAPRRPIARLSRDHRHVFSGEA